MAILQRPFLDCVTQSMFVQAGLPDIKHRDVRAAELLDECGRHFTERKTHCKLNLSVPYPMTFARDHHLRSSQGMAMWRESNTSASEFKRLLIQRGLATAEDALTHEPVQLTWMHLQGQSKRFHSFLSHALHTTAKDPHAAVRFGPRPPPPAPDAPPPAPAKGAPAGARSGGAGEVPLVFSPVSPCTPLRRSHLLDAVRHACRVVGAPNVFVIDEAACVAGAVPAGATVLPVELLLAGRCGAAAREFNRSYVHLSSNSVALEKMSMIRWLLLRCLAESRGWKSLMHAEGDVILLAHPMHFPPPDPAACGAAPTAAGHTDPPEKVAVSIVSGRSGHSAVLQAPFLACIADTIHAAYTNPTQLAGWQRTYREGYVAKRKPGGICDMTFVDSCAARLRAAAAAAGGGGQCVVTSQDPWTQDLLFDPGPGGPRAGRGLLSPHEAGNSAAGRGGVVLEVHRGMVLGRRPGEAAAVRLLSLRLGQVPARVYKLVVAALVRTRADPEAAIRVDSMPAHGGAGVEG